MKEQHGLHLHCTASEGTVNLRVSLSVKLLTLLGTVASVSSVTALVLSKCAA
jgi:hypothetical protein